MIYFASDVHLGGGTPQEARATERKFVAWLDMAARDAEAIFLVGDIFDFWFEYRRVVPQGFVRTLGKLAELTDRGIRVVLFTGNHDMWMGDYLPRECGVEIRTAPCTVSLCGRRIFIAHGDNMKIDAGRPSSCSTAFSARGFCAGFSHGACTPTWPCGSDNGGAASRARPTAPKDPPTPRWPNR